MEFATNIQPKNLEEANQIIFLLKGNIKNQQEKIETIQLQYENLQQQVINLLRGKYGKKSEKISEGHQFDLFAGEEIETPEPVEEPNATETITYTRKKRNGHRNIPDNLPRERIEHRFTQDS